MYLLAGLFLFLAGGAVNPVFAQVPISLFQSFAGNTDITTTAGTLRAAANPNACVVNPTSTSTLGGFPAGASVRAAYLYWAGSGTGDTDGVPGVILNGTTVFPSRTFSENYQGTYDYFSGFADVTPLISVATTSVTFGGLGVNTGAPHCASQAVAAGWGLLVVFDAPSEPLRVVNVYDGFQAFRGGFVDVTPSNFVIPGSGIDGKNAVLSWEGDPGGNSYLGFSEDVLFNGVALSTPLSPIGDQYNSTVSALAPPLNAQQWGVDFDVYDISALLSPGDASATSRYQSGSDLVLLSMKAISVTNTPVADLGITKSIAGNLIIGQTNTYTLDVVNNGPSANTGAVTVTDTLPAGLGFVSGTGGSWSCSAIGQAVTCSHPGPLAAGASLASLALNVSASPAAQPSVTNTASVSGSEFDNIVANNASTIVTPVTGSDLSTSTKTVVDLNGGDADPGDVLRYTISLIETSGTAATGVAVLDDVPTNVVGFSVVRVPGGATDNSLPAPAGGNANGLLDVSNITVPASGTVDVVFDVTIDAVAPGTVIDNTASISNPSGLGATVSAPQVTVSVSSTPASGNKPLYLYSSSTINNPLPPFDLSRTPPEVAQNSVRLRKNAGPASATWILTPQTQLPLTIDSGGGSIPVVLWLRKGGAGGGPVSRTLTIQLDATGATTGVIGAPIVQAVTVTGTPQQFTFNVPIGSDMALAAGTAVELTVTNTTPVGGNGTFRVFPIGTTSNSRVILPSLNVINVDSIGFYNAAYAGGTAIRSENPGGQTWIRSVISDPFGSFDIAGALVTITNPSGTPVVSNAPMPLVNDSSAATATFEYLFNVPGGGPDGVWTATVTANEGTEGTVSHQGAATISIGSPNIIALKTVQVFRDPVSGVTNPKSIPGAESDYFVQFTNQGDGPAETLTIDDAIQPDTALFVGDLDGSGSPIVFQPQTSGLSYTFVSLGDPGDDIDFADSGGFGYVPVPDASGYDGNVTAIRITPANQFEGGQLPTSFNLQLRVRLK